MSEDRDGLLCLGPCGGSRDNNVWMCDDCWDIIPRLCIHCGYQLHGNDNTHYRKPCPNSKERKKTVKIEDFENEDWFKFLPPSLQEEAVASINSKVPSGGSLDPDHNCIENIDCCDAFRYAQEQDCSKLKDYHASDDCDHDDCYSSDTLQERLDELKAKIKNFIDEQ